MENEIEIDDKICLVDLDGTLADYTGALERDLERLRNPVEPKLSSQKWGWPKEDDFDENLPDWYKARMHLIKSVPGWWRNLPKLDDGFQILDLAVKIGFKPEILTKGPFRSSQAWTEKYDWCRQNIDKDGHTKEPIDIGITFNKGRVYGRVLVEDYVPYVEAWLKFRKRGFVVLMDRPYNQGFFHPQVERYNGTGSSHAIIQERMQHAFNRQALPSTI